jgi:hypothetical protein
MAFIQRTVYDGSSIDIAITDLPGALVGVESITFGTSLDCQKVKGSGRVYRAYTPGIINAENGSLTIWTSELHNWLEHVGGIAGFHTNLFDITITYRETGLPLQTVVLKDCKAIGVNSTHSIGTAENTVATVDFMVLDIVYNGKGLIGKIAQEAMNIVRGTGLSSLIPGF